MATFVSDDAKGYFLQSLEAALSSNGLIRQILVRSNRGGIGARPGENEDAIRCEIKSVAQSE